MSACILLPWRGDYKLIKNPSLFTEHTRSWAPRRGPASHDEGSFVTPAATAPGGPPHNHKSRSPAPPLGGETRFPPPRPELHPWVSVVSRRSEPVLGFGSRGSEKEKVAPCSSWLVTQIFPPCCSITVFGRATAP